MQAFESVMGYDALKQELTEIIDIMQNREVYEALNASCPNGLLLYGVPGVGKTLIATSFIEASGRPSVICRKNASEQSFIDSISEAFNEALEKAPSIILLDDMDKFANDDDDHKDSEAYVTIQSCIDTVRGKDVFVVATANNIHKLPDSLIRTGRFDRRVEVERPDEEDSQKIIEHYLAGMGLEDDVDVQVLASFFRGSSCSTIEAVVNQAGISAGYRRSDHITMEDLIQSYIQIAHHIPKRNLLVPSDVDLKATDGSVDVMWHEAGHAVMSELLEPGSVSMVIAAANDNGREGFTIGNFKHSSRGLLARMKAEVMISLASAATIDIVFGKIDLGASEDIQSALKTIDALVGKLGGFAGLSMATVGYRSDAMDEKTEIAVSAIAELYYQETKEILCQNRAFLETMAKRLAEKVVLTAIDITEMRESLGL